MAYFSVIHLRIVSVEKCARFYIDSRFFVFVNLKVELFIQKLNNKKRLKIHKLNYYRNKIQNTKQYINNRFHYLNKTFLFHILNNKQI